MLEIFNVNNFSPNDLLTIGYLIGITATSPFVYYFVKMIYNFDTKGYYETKKFIFRREKKNA